MTNSHDKYSHNKYFHHLPASILMAGMYCWGLSKDISTTCARGGATPLPVEHWQGRLLLALNQRTTPSWISDFRLALKVLNRKSINHLTVRLHNSVKNLVSACCPTHIIFLCRALHRIWVFPQECCIDAVIFVHYSWLEVESDGWSHVQSWALHR